MPEGINWLKLEHAGVVFAPNHVRHFVPLLYDSKRVELNAEQEELATFYASIPEDGPQLGNIKTRSVFQKISRPPCLRDMLFKSLKSVILV